METEAVSSTQPPPNRLGKCEVCETIEAKYTCPKCEVKTCGLACNKIHKTELECDGERDKTKFVPLHKFTNLDLLSDYRLLEHITQSVGTIKKTFGWSKHAHELPPHLYKLKNAAYRKRITLRFLPFKFQRHRSNTTFLHFKSNRILWHLEWMFVNADNLKLDEKRVSETEKLGTALSRIIREQTDAVLQDRLQYYKSADLAGTRLFLKAEHKPGQKFYELDQTLTIQDNLAGKTLIEYPTIHVVLKDHGHGYDVVDSDEEGEEETQVVEVNSGRAVVDRMLKNEERKEAQKGHTKNFLFNGSDEDSD